jgi:hypothetical protein
MSLASLAVGSKGVEVLAGFIIEPSRTAKFR